MPRSTGAKELSRSKRTRLCHAVMSQVYEGDETCAARKGDCDDEGRQPWRKIASETEELDKLAMEFSQNRQLRQAGGGEAGWLSTKSLRADGPARGVCPQQTRVLLRSGVSAPSACSW